MPTKQMLTVLLAYASFTISQPVSPRGIIPQDNECTFKAAGEDCTLLLGAISGKCQGSGVIGALAYLTISSCSNTS